jgi:hypothetical protein
MREIKFRAWRENEDGRMAMIDGDSLAFEEYAPVKDHLNQEGIMQFIGKYDKNGKDIYEGDVAMLKNRTAYYVCAYDNFQCCFYWDCLVTDDYDNMLAEAEIIGNIYDNPELCQN